jgi:glutathione synthase/RimK-type ligase-like ATP-grasp enzyme
MQQIGFATSSEIPQGADDDRIVRDALRRRGFNVVSVIWDTQESLRTVPPTVVIRSCWNYHHQPHAFLEWVARLEHQGTRVFNSCPVIEWNIDKHYLNDLATLDIALPATVWVERGTQTDLLTLLHNHDMDNAVIKPVVSLSAYKTRRTSRAEAQAHQAAFDALVAEQGMLVQAYVPEIELNGEISLVFFSGSYSHSVLKRPAAGDFRVQMDFGGTRATVIPPDRVLAQAQAIVGLAPEPVLYARVDGIDTGEQFLLMELELIDPVLFFAFDTQAPERFATALVQTLGLTDTSH